MSSWNLQKSLQSLLHKIDETFLKGFSLRAKLIVGNMAITVLAIFIMGLYVYIRSRDANDALINRLEENVRAKAEENLMAASMEQSALLDSFFSSMSSNTTIVGKTVSDMLANPAPLQSGGYWDAAETLKRLPSGSWDNPNTEASSIFIPAKVQLTSALTTKLNVLKHSDLFIPSILADNPDIIAIYFGGASQETIYYPNIDLAAIVPPDFDVTQRPWYVDASPANNPDRSVVWSAPYIDAALNGLVITTSLPIFNQQDAFQGVAAMDIQLAQITRIVSNIQAGESGYAILIDNENRLIALPEAGYGDFGVTADNVPLGSVISPAEFLQSSPDIFPMLDVISSREEGLTSIQIHGEERLVAYQQVPEIGYKLAIIVPLDELITESVAAREQLAAELGNTLLISLVLIAFIFAVALIASYGIGHRFTTPLEELTDVAKQITSGNLEARSDIKSQDEIGTLANTINTMTATLRNSIQTLEQRVEERTAALQEELRKGERREKQYEAIAKVAQVINATQDLHDLLPKISEVISQQFGFYHVGIFLNDPSGQYSVLSAANSDGGRRMLDRGHQLKIGEQGIVGYVTGTGRPRVALDVGSDVVYFNNPDMPDTHSEMALPLNINGKIIGALDVQSTVTNAFTEEDVEVLSTLADQVSLAIQNAQFYEQMQRSLAEAEIISRQYFSETWSQIAKAQAGTGYRYTTSGTVQLTAADEADHTEDTVERKSVSVPIVVRGQVVGKLAVLVPKTERIKSDQMELIQAVADRVSIFADNARLFDETTRRAERERLVSDITTKIRSTNDPQEMLDTAIKELQQVLKISRIDIVPQKNVAPDK